MKRKINTVAELKQAIKDKIRDVKCEISDPELTAKFKEKSARVFIP